MSSKLKITQIRGLVAISPEQRGTVRALGLKRIGHTVIKEDRPEIRGMTSKVGHLIKVEEIKARKARKVEKKDS